MAQYTDYVAPLTDLVRKPAAFFKAASEKTLAPVIIFLLVNYVVTQVIALIISIPYLREASLLSFVGIFFGVVFTAIAWLVLGGIAHLAVKIVGYTGEIVNTLKVVGYSWGLVMWWGILSALVTTVLALTGVLPEYETLNDPALNPTDVLSEGILTAIVGLAFLVIVVLHASYLMITGFKVYHKMPQNKAVLAVIVSWVIVAVPVIIFTIILGGLLAVVSQV